MERKMSQALKQINAPQEEDKQSTAEDSDPKIAEG